MCFGGYNVLYEESSNMIFVRSNPTQPMSPELFQNNIVACVLLSWLEKVTDYSEPRLASEMSDFLNGEEANAGTINVHLNPGIRRFVPGPFIWSFFFGGFRIEEVNISRIEHVCGYLSDGNSDNQLAFLIPHVSDRFPNIAPNNLRYSFKIKDEQSSGLEDRIRIVQESFHFCVLHWD